MLPHMLTPFLATRLAPTKNFIGRRPPETRPLVLPPRTLGVTRCGQPMYQGPTTIKDETPNSTSGKEGGHADYFDDKGGLIKRGTI